MQDQDFQERLEQSAAQEQLVPRCGRARVAAGVGHWETGEKVGGRVILAGKEGMFQHPGASWRV